MPDYNQNEAAAARAVVDARKSREAANKQAAADVDERSKVQQEQVKEQAKRLSASQPTPTQRENDLAKVGALDIDDKEDDGSGSDDDAVRKIMESKLPGGSPYETRTTTASRSSTTTSKGSKR